MDYTTMNIDDIIKYCQEQGPEVVAWLNITGFSDKCSANFKKKWEALRLPKILL